MQSPSLKAAFQLLTSKIPGIEHICISNPYGLPIIRFAVADEAAAASATPSAVVETVETTAATLFAMTAEAFDKLPQRGAVCGPSCAPSTFGLGKTRAVVCTGSEGRVVVQASLNPLVLSIVASADANVELLLKVIPQLQALLEPVRKLAEDGGAAES
jgi:hypothetical protein